jgi:hypothetical protein
VACLNEAGTVSVTGQKESPLSGLSSFILPFSLTNMTYDFSFASLLDNPSFSFGLFFIFIS